MADKKQETAIVDITIAAPADKVWDALRDPEQLMNWFGWDAETLRDEIQFIFFDHSVVDETARTITGEPYQGVTDRIEVHSTGTGSIVRVVRAGPPPEGGWDAVYDDIYEGWISFFQQLRLLVDRHPGGKRRTVFLAGMRRSPGPLPVAALGLDALFTTPAGEPRRFELPVGETIEGDVWHHSKQQIGISVGGWGDGLLIVTNKPGKDGAPGGGSAILTTFNLRPDVFAQLEQRWHRWWEAVFPPA